ncbi:hypothetical protein TSUD_246830 [Trifolium subterraneum]|uniref:Uncharacterized protein n=1 Tax=Trifolium subterraneum TaxID=3900 RepID=A0A2Z6NM92_TRISU|nr:hypothetical protein TSUD_246830 [Trifolium subterraneum]
MSLGYNDGNYMVNSSVSGNAGVSILRNMLDNGSSNFIMRFPHILSPAFLGNGPYPGLLPTAMESLSDHVRSRWIHNNGNQVDRKKLFQLDLDNIKSDEDTRTTLMIKNIANKY